MRAALNPAQLFALLDAGDTVVLPTSLAARTLRWRFDARQRARGLRLWEPAPVLAWNEWTASLWSTAVLEGIDDRLLLNRVQEEALWTEILTQSSHTTPLSLPAAQNLAELARSGFALAASHNAVSRLRSTADTFDARSFAACVDRFQEHCAANKLLPAALLEATLAKHIRSGALPLPAPLHLAGCDIQTPSEMDLLATFRVAGTRISEKALSRSSSSADPRPRSVTLADPQQELQFSARLLALWAESLPPSETEPAFAVILPEISESAPELDRLLRQHLAPELEVIHADLSSRPWQFARQPPLASVPIVADALLLLRWTAAALSLDRIRHLLLSAFFDLGDSLEARARFEARVLQHPHLLRPELDLPAFLHLVARDNRGAGDLVASFSNLRSLARGVELAGLRSMRSCADWSDLVRALLRTSGWPGPRVLSPAEFGATEAWESLLDLVATLDFTGRRLTFSAFLDTLDRESHNVRGPALGGTAPVQVLTLAESEGIPFDAAMVLGATDNHLPSPERLHPLLGRRLQIDLKLPGADPSLTHARSRDALERLMQRCGQTLLVAPRADENGPLRGTPLAAELGFAPSTPEALLPGQLASETITTILVPDDTPIPPLPSAHVEGGARVLELQAACGFRAFATLRLHADPLEHRSLGIDARDAGNLLHRALESFWKETKDQARLRAFSWHERQAAIQRSVDLAFARLRSHTSPQASWDTTYLNLLEQRFAHLLSRWLDFELSRGPFTVVAEEEKRDIDIGPLQLSVKPDRLDRVKDGFVFVDYKSGRSHSTDDWLGPRPDAPQLPLYVLLAEPREVRGLAFARVRPGKDMGWISLADQPGHFQRKGDNKVQALDEQIEAWHSELNHLAHAFAAGNVAVNPKQYPSTCNRCSHRLLCRLNPVTLLEQNTEQDPSLEETDV